MSFILVDDGEISYLNPFGAEKTKELEHLLSSSNCFVPSFVGEDPYSLDTYIVQYALHRTETVFLFDRNVYSDILSLAKGEQVSESTQVSAAIMAFASSVNASVEPAIALHEGAGSGANGGWKRDLSLFHASDNIHPVNWGHAGTWARQQIRSKDCRDTLFRRRSLVQSEG